MPGSNPGFLYSAVNDSPFESLPPVPDDLWPRVPSPNSSAQALPSEAFPASMPGVAGILGRAVHAEMRSAGEYAARAVLTAVYMRPHELHLRAVELRFHSRFHAESAARLLQSYRMVRGELSAKEALLLPSSDQLKTAATRSYRVAMKNEIVLQHEIEVLKAEQPGFNDELFCQLKKKVPGQGTKLRL